MKKLIYVLLLCLAGTLPLAANGLSERELPDRSLEHDLAAIAISWDLNLQPIVNVNFAFEVAVSNLGTQPQNVYTVKLYDGTGSILATQNGYNIQPGQNQAVFLNWLPSAAGAVTIYAKVILPWDENPYNDQSPNYLFDVHPYPNTLVTVVGSGSELLRIPIDLYYQNSLFETLYYPAEMDNLSGAITGLRFFSNLISNLTDIPLRVWLGTTTLPNLSAGWIPSTELTLVFDSMVNLPPNDNMVELPLLEPFMYLNGENLVLMVQRPMDTQYYVSSDRFRGQTAGSNRARKSQSDSAVFNPAAPPSNCTISGEFPKTGFVFIPMQAGTLQGTVVGTDNWPLPNATVQVLDTEFGAQTNYSGVFSLHLPTGTYSVSASATDYNPQTLENVIVNADLTTTISFSLISVSASDPVQPLNSTLLLGLSPNPADSETQIRYRLQKAGKVKLSIYDIRGRLVRALVDAEAPAGISSALWDGKNDRGKAVSAGVYLIQMNAADYRGTRKLIMTK